MDAKVKYIYWTDGGFRYECSTPDEAVSHFEGDFKELRKLVAAMRPHSGDFCDRELSTLVMAGGKVILNGRIDVRLEGIDRAYVLETKIIE